MRTASILALTAALLAGSLAIAAPADAQNNGGAAAPAQPPAPARKFNFSKGAVKSLQALQTAVNNKDEANYPAALAAAQAAATNSDDRFVVAQLQYKHASDTSNTQEKLAGLQAMIQSGGANGELASIYGSLAQINYDAQNYDATADAFQKLSEMDPKNVDVALDVARVRGKQKRYPEAVAAAQAAIGKAKAAGQPVPEEAYKLALQFAIDGHVEAQATQVARDWLTAYPSVSNWRDALMIYRQGTNLDRGANLDLMRLMRAAKAMKGERDWFELADTANDAGLPGETKAVLDEAIAARQIDPAKPTFKDLINASNGKIAADRASLAGLEKQAAAAPQGRVAANTADAYLGYGQYDKAAALYRTALQKGSVDANVINTRLGIALALGGHKDEAETALKSVTGPRSDIAAFWLLWVNQRA